MIFLRDLARNDKAVGMISSADCLLIAQALYLVVDLCNGIFIKFLVPRSMREKLLSLRMLAATLSRTPEERCSFGDAIAKEMERDRER
jgi:hypothetical protein